LFAASLVGFLDDILQVISPPSNAFLRSLWERMNKYMAGGLSLKHRFALITLIGFIGAWWFFYKLGWDTVHIPGGGDIFLGWLMIPFFIVVMLATYSGGVIDGIDGLSGGAFASMFTAYGLIAFSQGQVDLAAFCFAVVGSILAFL
jgi:phospho-N-acetylmuramoyl-pentapeptide-transferase